MLVSGDPGTNPLECDIKCGEETGISRRHIVDSERYQESPRTLTLSPTGAGQYSNIFNHNKVMYAWAGSQSAPSTMTRAQDRLAARLLLPRDVLNAEVTFH